MKIPEHSTNIQMADCIVGHSFGTSIGPDSVNARLAARMLLLQTDRDQPPDSPLPMIADRTLVNAMPNGDDRMAHVVEGPVTSIANKGRGVGTWGTLVEARDYMEERGLYRPLMVAQAYHIGRVVAQAAKLGIRSIVPDGLPKVFDKNSDQIWTRSLHLWQPFNKLVAPVILKARGQL